MKGSNSRFARQCSGSTGWGGGGPDVGKRVSLKNTRAIIDAIHDGSLAKAKTEKDPVFGFDGPAECPGVPPEILIPRNAWADKAAYEDTAKAGRPFQQKL